MAVLLCFVLLPLVMAMPARGQSGPDSDSDGLADADEIALHGTSPFAADTDGDGQWDGAELQSGTDPSSASSSFRITGPPAPLQPSGYRISWASVPGRAYRLERQSTLQGTWTQVGQISASNNTTSLDDSSPASSAGAFYRVSLLGTGGPLAVSQSVWVPGRGWNVSWSSQPGIAYRLDRALQNAPSLLSWTLVSNVTANSFFTTFLDTQAPETPSPAYRVQTALPADVAAPTLHDLKSNPTEVTSEGWVVLEVVARDNQGVTQVEWFRGNVSIGRATPAGGNVWRLAWNVDRSMNGDVSLVVRAQDAAHNISAPGTMMLPVRISTSQVLAAMVGGIAVKADILEIDGNQVFLKGSPTVGRMVLSTAQAPTFLRAENLVTGEGWLSIPGLGPIWNGQFALPLALGSVWLTNSAGGTLQPIMLSDRVKLIPQWLEISLTSSLMRGAGVFEILVADDQPPARVEGTFELDPLGTTAEVVGSASYLGARLTGQTRISREHGLFESAGSLHIEGITNQSVVFVLEPASFDLTKSEDGTRFFRIAGQPTVPGLSAMSMILTGTLTAQGELELRGAGSGSLGSIEFSSIHALLKRGTNILGRPDLTFKGPVNLRDTAYASLTGEIFPDGRLRNLKSDAELQLGRGIRIQPRLNDQGGVVPVLLLTGSTNNRHTFRIQGNFLTPDAGGVKPIEVDGGLILNSQGNELLLESCEATNRLPHVHWPLPDGVRLSNVWVRIALDQAEVRARMGGQLILGKPGQSLTTTLTLDAGLTINHLDPADITIDSLLKVAQLGVVQQVWVGDSTWHLLLGTKPPRALLALLDGNVGFFPLRPIPPPDPGTNAPAQGGNASQTNTNKPPSIQRKDFQLFLEKVGGYLEIVGDDFHAVLTNGALKLPHIFTNLPPNLCPNQSSGTSIQLGPSTALSMSVSHLPVPSVTVRATGSMEFQNIQVLPAGNGFAAELCSAKLFFNPGGLPYLSNILGTAAFPLPKGQTNKVQIQNGAWNLLGFPSGTIALVTDLTLNISNTLQLKFLAQGSTQCRTGTTFTVLPSAPGTFPPIRLTGGVQVELPASALTDVQGDTVKTIVCGILDLPGQPGEPPSLQLPNLSIGGTFHVGGRNGIVLSNALLSLANAHNFFALDDNRTAGLGITGSLIVPKGPTFTMEGASLTWFDPSRPPKFAVRGVGYSSGQFFLAKSLPAKVSKASFLFINTNLAFPSLLDPTNVVIEFSAGITLPSEQKSVFKGSVDKVKMKFNAQRIPTLESINGLRLGIGDLEIPPIEKIGGELSIAGLGKIPLPGGAPALADLPLPDPSDLEDIVFAGSVEGSYQGYKLRILLAGSPSGLVGVCLDFNAGSVGIPLDGGTLGGILLSGASGGIMLRSGGGDPCDFTAFLDAEGKPKPGITGWPPIKLKWEDLATKIGEMKARAHKFAPGLPGLAEAARAQGNLASPGRGPALAEPALAGVLPHVRYTNEFGLPCPGDCPPATVNIFCQPHPDRERFPHHVIFKFSSIQEPTLNSWGFTRQRVRSYVGQTTNGAVRLATDLAAAFRTQLFNLIPKPDPGSLGAAQAQQLLDIIQSALLDMEREFIPMIVDKIGNEQNADRVYDLIRDTAYEGAPCIDISLSISGTFTHQVVSSFLSGTVGGSVTTAGNAGVSGRIHLLGVPFGKAKAFIAGTDENGDPNPSLCGEVEVAVGPLGLGAMRASFQCDDCVTGATEVFLRILGCASEQAVFSIVRRIAPEIELQGITKLQLRDRLTPEQKLALVAQFYSRPDLMAQIQQCLLQNLESLADTIDPEFLLCGQVQPKLFGLPLGPSFYSAGMQINRRGMIGAGSYSPSATLALPFLAAASSATGGTLLLAAGPLAVSMFAQDQATYGMSLQVTDPTELVRAGLSGQMSSPQQFQSFAEAQFNRFLANANYTFAYSLSPMGFKTLDSQMRVVLPNFLAHPEDPSRPGGAWIRPENRSPALPSRLSLVVSAVTNRLPGSSLGLIADPSWKGTSSDLFRAFGDPAQQAQVAGRSFAQDYFPHGGVIGGATVQIPRALYEAPPAELGIALDPNNDVLTRLSAAATYLFDYVMKSREAGQLGFYIPAPNPPFFRHQDGSALKPQEMLELINGFNLDDLKTPRLYSAAEFFLKGRLDGQLLGVPIAQASIEAALADAATGNSGLFRVDASVPAGSWLSQFTPGAQLLFEMKGSPPQPIDTIFSNAWVRIRDNTNGNPGPAVLAGLLNETLAHLSNSLPKVRLEAALAMRMPAALSNVIQFSSGNRLLAYSPRYEPTYLPQDLGPAARARRQGGIAFQGDLMLRAQGRTVASIQSAELSVNPRSSGLPAMAGRFIAPTLNLPPLAMGKVSVDFSNDPTPSFTAEGAISPFNIGPMKVEGQGGTSLTGRVSVAGVGPGLPVVNLAVRPARLTLPGFLTRTLLIHGASPTAPFTISATEPWNATIQSGQEFHLEAGGISILRLAASNVGNTVTLSGDGTNKASFEVTIRRGTQIIVFPGSTYEQTLQLGPDATASLLVRSDRTFELRGQLGANMNFHGLPTLPVSTIGASATFLLNQDFLELSGTLTGGSLAQAGGGLNASGTVRILRTGEASVSGSGSVSVSPFGFGQFFIEGPNGGNLSGTLSNDGLSLTGGRFGVRGLTTNSLPPWNLPASGNFGVHVGPVAANVGGFTFSNFEFQLGRTNGVWSMMGVQGTLSEPSGLLPSLLFSGSISSDGSVSFSNSGPASSRVGGFAFTSLQLALTNTPSVGAGIRLSGQLNLPPFANHAFLGEASRGPAGTTLVFRYSGGVALPGFQLQNAQLSLLASPGTLPQMSFNGDMSVPLFPPLNLAGNIQTSGNFSVTNRLSSGALGGFNFNGMTNVLQRGGGRYDSLIMAASPHAYWRLEEPKGSLTAISQTGGKTAGEYVKSPDLGVPGALPDKSTTGVKLDGAAQYITIPDAKAFDQVTTGLTVVAWVKIPRFDRTWETIIAKGDNSWRVQRAGNLNTASFDTDGVNPPYLSGSRRLDDDQWHHVAAVFDGTAKYLFVDGELDAWTPASGSIQLSTFPVWIGANADRPGRNWGGSLDEVAVFTRGLTGAEIQELYRSGGGIALQTAFSLNYSGMSGMFFRGSVAGNGNFDLSSSSAGISIGGFQMGPASFRMARGGGLTQINGQGLLAVPGLPAARMAGRLLPDNTVDLRATLGSAQILAFSLNNLGFILAGPISSPTLTLSGEIGVSGWGTVPLSGTVTTSGFFNLMGSPGFPSFMNFPVQAPSLTLRRQPGDYKDMVSGRSFPFQSLGDRPLAHWRLDETSGTVALDSHTRSGLGDVARNGTYSGTLLLSQPGALSGDLNSGSPSVRFDGVTTKVTVGSESTFDLRQAISVEAWIKVAAWDRPWQAIVTKGDSAWRLSRWDQGRGLAFDTSSGGIAHGTRSSKPVDDGQWHHVVAVYDGTAKYLYIDGILEAFDLYSEAIDLNDAPVMIGENAEATNRHFDGWIDEVAIYSRALQPNQVLNHYVAGGGGGLQSAFTLAIPNGIGSISVSGSMHPSGSACLVGTANNLPLPYLSLNSAVMTLARPAGAPATTIAQGNAQTPFGSSFFFGTVSSSGDYTLRTRATGSFLVGGFTLNHDAAFELKPTQLSGSGQLNFHGYSITSSLKAERSGQTTLTGGISKGFGWEMFGIAANGAKDQPFAAASGSLDVRLDSQLNVQARFRGNFAAWYSPVYQKDVFEPPTNISSLNLGFFNQVATFNQKPYTSLRVESTWDVNSDGTVEILENFQGIARYVFDLW